MLKRISPLAVLVGVLVVPGVASATLPNRTWVSGMGDDANPCSRTAPCKTWAGAFSKTAGGGEIDAIDPGGYGALTITKPITIDGGSGQVAGVLVSGINGVNVAAGPSDQVILRNLDVNGSATDNPSQAGLDGVSFTSGGSLRLENDKIFGFSQNGVSDTAPNSSLVVSGTTITHGAGNGVMVAPPGGASAQALLESTSVENNGGTGVLASGSGSTAYLSDVSVFGNGTGLSAINGGSIVAVGPDNFVEGNATNGNATSTVGASAQGQPGAPGQPGQPGAQGPQGRLVLVSCHTIATRVKVRARHGKSRTVTRRKKQCTARPITGTVTFISG